MTRTKHAKNGIVLVGQQVWDFDARVKALQVWLSSHAALLERNFEFMPSKRKVDAHDAIIRCTFKHRIMRNNFIGL